VPSSPTPHSAQWNATGWRIAAPHAGQFLTSGWPHPAQNRSLGYPIAPQREHRAMPAAATPLTCGGREFLPFIILSVDCEGPFETTAQTYPAAVTI
jgi:hypothetical protein